MDNKIGLQISSLHALQVNLKKSGVLYKIFINLLTFNFMYAKK